jgi:hypothetical protein
LRRRLEKAFCSQGILQAQVDVLLEVPARAGFGELLDNCAGPFDVNLGVKRRLFFKVRITDVDYILIVYTELFFLMAFVS